MRSAGVLLSCLLIVSLSFAQEVEIYRSKEPILALELEVIRVNVEVIWTPGNELSIKLIGESAREFAHKVRYTASTGVLSVKEEIALGQRVGDFWTNRQLDKAQERETLLMRITIPRSFNHIIQRFKVLQGALSIYGNELTLRQSLSVETLQGTIMIEQLVGTVLTIKSAQGDLTLNNVKFEHVWAQSIHGNITINLIKNNSAIFLRAGQLAGGALINGERRRLPLQLDSVGLIGNQEAKEWSELEVRSGYGRFELNS